MHITTFQTYLVDGRGRLNPGTDIDCDSVGEACDRAKQALCSGGRIELWAAGDRVAQISAYSARDFEIITCRPSALTDELADQRRQAETTMLLARSTKLRLASQEKRVASLAVRADLHEEIAAARSFLARSRERLIDLGIRRSL